MTNKKATEIGLLVLLSFELRKELRKLDQERDVSPDNFEAIDAEIETIETRREKISEKLAKYGVDVLI